MTTTRTPGPRGPLSLVPPTAPAPRKPVKRSDDRAARIWADERLRASPGTRELVLAMEHVLTRRAPANGKQLRATLREMLGRDQIGRNRARELTAADAPRYEPNRDRYWIDRLCMAPRVRPRPYNASGRIPSTTCDAIATLNAVEVDPVTGWEIDRWYCTRHRDHYERVLAQIATDAATRDKVEPIPNRGGLLPCYFGADWETLYAKVSPHWKPPVYGVCADDWPVPGAPASRIVKPRLRLIPVFDGMEDA